MTRTQQVLVLFLIVFSFLVRLAINEVDKLMKAVEKDVQTQVEHIENQ